MHRGGRRLSGATIDLRDRVAANNQLLLTAIVGALFVVGFATQSLRNPELFGLGVLVIVVGAGASLAVPWTRIAPAWVAIIPLVDIGAIALLRASDPSGGLGLLWAFPVLSLSSLGRGAFLLSSVLVTAVYWVVVATSGATERTYAPVLLPMLIFAIGWASYPPSVARLRNAFCSIGRPTAYPPRWPRRIGRSNWSPKCSTRSISA